MPFAGFKGAAESNSSVFWGLGGEGKGLWDEKKGEDRKRGTDGCQQKLEPKAGDKLCFLSLLILKGAIAIVITAWNTGPRGIQGRPERKAFCSSLASLMFLEEPEAGGGGFGQQVVFVSPLFPSLLCSEVSLS